MGSTLRVGQRICVLRLGAALLVHSLLQIGHHTTIIRHRFGPFSAREDPVSFTSPDIFQRSFVKDSVSPRPETSQRPARRRTAIGLFSVFRQRRTEAEKRPISVRRRGGNWLIGDRDTRLVSDADRLNFSVRGSSSTAATTRQLQAGCEVSGRTRG